MERFEYYKTALKIRTEWGMEDMQRDRDIPFPEYAEAKYDIPYGEDIHWQITDIYTPKGKKGPFPVIVSVHGGGWIYSHKEHYRAYCASLTKYGFAVVNFNYRLAPEAPYPAALEDINRLFGWLLEHAEEYDIDKNKICAVGDSAGAQMLSHYLTMWSNSDYPAPFKVKEGLSIKAVALNCGAYDLPGYLNRNGLDPYLEAYFCGDSVKCSEAVNIMPYLRSTFPPSYIMTSVNDFLRNEAKPFYEALKEEGVHCEYHLYGDDNTQELGHVFHCNMNLAKAWECNEDECRFFNEIIK